MKKTAALLMVLLFVLLLAGTALADSVPASDDPEQNMSDLMQLINTMTVSEIEMSEGEYGVVSSTMLRITRDLKLTGAGMDKTICQAGIFVASGSTVVLKDFTFTGVLTIEPGACVCIENVSAHEVIIEHLGGNGPNGGAIIDGGKLAIEAVMDRRYLQGSDTSTTIIDGDLALLATNVNECDLTSLTVTGDLTIHGRSKSAKMYLSNNVNVGGTLQISDMYTGFSEVYVGDAVYFLAALTGSDFVELNGTMRISPGLVEGGTLNECMLYIQDKASRKGKVAETPEYVPVTVKDLTIHSAASGNMTLTLFDYVDVTLENTDIETLGDGAIALVVMDNAHATISSGTFRTGNGGSTTIDSHGHASVLIKGGTFMGGVLGDIGVGGLYRVDDGGVVYAEYATDTDISVLPTLSIPTSSIYGLKKTVIPSANGGQIVIEWPFSQYKLTDRDHLLTEANSVNGTLRMVTGSKAAAGASIEFSIFPEAGSDGQTARRVTLPIELVDDEYVTLTDAGSGTSVSFYKMFAHADAPTFSCTDTLLESDLQTMLENTLVSINDELLAVRVMGLFSGEQPCPLDSGIDLHYTVPISADWHTEYGYKVYRFVAPNALQQLNVKQTETALEFDASENGVFIFVSAGEEIKAQPTPTPVPSESADPSASTAPTATPKPMATPKPAANPMKIFTGIGIGAGVVLIALVVIAVIIAMKRKKQG